LEETSAASILGQIADRLDTGGLQKLPLLEWTEKYRIIAGEPFRIDRWPHYFPYLKPIYNDDSRQLVIMKCAQVGVSELAINKSLWALDQHRMDVMYLLPTREEAADFSAGRFDPALEESSYLDRLFIDVKNVGHKRTGAANYYLRGTQKRSQLKSVPIDFLIKDELDEMVQKNLSLADTRLDASPFKWKLDLSTPTVPEFGIHARFLESDQHELHARCPHCGTWQRPTYKDNVEHDGEPPFYKCSHCSRPTETFLTWDLEWVAGQPTNGIRGYHLTQLLSPHTTAAELAEFASKPENEQEFYNSKLGEPHVAKGGQLTEDILNACCEAGYVLPSTGRHCTMGVDVGKVLNVRVSNWERDGDAWQKVARVIDTVREFTELDDLMDQYDVDICVIDALPETRLAKAFADRFKGRVWLAYYNISHKSSEYCIWDDKKRVVRVQRNLALETMMSRYLTRRLVLPEHAALIPEFYAQLRAPKRVQQRDERTGNMVPRFLEDGKPDHYAHAEVYDDIAGSRWVKTHSATPAELDLLRRLKIYT